MQSRVSLFSIMYITAYNTIIASELYEVYNNVSCYICRNHAWVSFQGFAEAYNDAFPLPRALGKCMWLEM